MVRLPLNKAQLSRIGSGALARYIKFVHRTSRIVFEPADGAARFAGHHPMIFALWHGQFLMLPALNPDSVKVKIMVARHGDADVLGDLLTRFGMGLIRGAGAGLRKRDRGGAAALLAARKALDEGYSVGMTADVPPGPARRAGLGIVTLARVSGKPIIPVAVASSRYHALDTWSRLTINLPGSRLAVVVGDPIAVAADADAATLEVARKALEIAMNDATQRAYALAGADPARATPPGADPTAPPAPLGRNLKIYRSVMRAATPLAPAILRWREKRGKEDASRQPERLGRASAARPSGRLVWAHAASVGETNAVLPLLDELRAQRPDLRFLLTTGTSTSAALAATRLRPDDIHQYIPLDSPRLVDRFFDHWKPDLGIFTESEIWPNLIIAAADRDIPLALVNARLSPRSYKRWVGNRGMSRPLFNRFAVVLAQNEKLSRWFADVGARHTIPVGNLKIDSPPPPIDQQALARLQLALGNRPCMVASCTHKGEDEVVAAAHRLLSIAFPRFCTIIVPRHPVRAPEILAMLDALGLKAVLRSNGALPSSDTDIYIADTIGELGTVYATSRIAFLGKSLGINDGAKGGQNPIEAVRHDTAVLTGPHWGNFIDTYTMLKRHGGVGEVKDAAELAAQVTLLLRDPTALSNLKSGAQAALGKLAGAMAKTVAVLLPLIPATIEIPDNEARKRILRAS